MKIFKKYVDRFFDGYTELAIAATIIYGVSAIGLILCFVGIFIVIFGVAK